MIGKLSVMGLATLSAVALNASQFDDVKFWFNGGRLSHGDGTAVTGDFFDAAHASDPTHNNHKALFNWGYVENRQFVTTDVTIPMTGETKQMQVLRLSDVAHVNDTTTNVWPVSISLHNLRDNLVKSGVASETYTILMRLRRAGNPDDTNRVESVLNWGYEGYGGLYVRFCGPEDASKVNGMGVNGKYLSIYHAYNISDTQVGPKETKLNTNVSLFVPTNVWTDIGISVDHGKVQVAVVKPKAVRFPGSQSYNHYPPVGFANEFNCVNPTKNFTGSGSSATSLEKCMFVLGAEREWHGYYQAEKEAGAWDMAFRGDFQQFAIWDRALTKNEMLEAFGEPRPQIVKVGLANGTTDEFGGSRAVDGKQTIDADRPYSENCAKLAAGDETTITFVVRPGEAGLRQLAALYPTTTSVAGRVELTVNGVVCGTEALMQGERITWNVPGKAIRAGTNAVVLKRVDAGVGNVEIDFFTLGGSWQVGVAGSGDGYGSVRDFTNGRLGNPDVNPAHWTPMFATYEESKTVDLSFWVDAELAENSVSKLTIPISLGDNAGANNRGEDHRLQFMVNGVVKHSEPASRTAWPNWTVKTINLEFAKGELMAGWNTVNVQFLPADPSGVYSAYTQNDYYRFECGKLPKGMIILFR